VSFPAKGIAIVGGGIGGVATAVALEQAGIHATVYERALELREVGAGVILWPNATRVLRELGVLDRVAARSAASDNFLVRWISRWAILRCRRSARAVRICSLHW
jgi:2-polyprenyl-6-methoxyphenol hydroxylase-like FAD-dependent oxidoreductase